MGTKAGGAGKRHLSVINPQPVIMQMTIDFPQIQGLFSVWQADEERSCITGPATFIMLTDGAGAAPRVPLVNVVGN